VAPSSGAITFGRTIRTDVIGEREGKAFRVGSAQMDDPL
jgi:hypothetical protein